MDPCLEWDEDSKRHQIGQQIFVEIPSKRWLKNSARPRGQAGANLQHGDPYLKAKVTTLAMESVEKAEEHISHLIHLPQTAVPGSLQDFMKHSLLLKAKTMLDDGEKCYRCQKSMTSYI